MVYLLVEVKHQTVAVEHRVLEIVSKLNSVEVAGVGTKLAEHAVAIEFTNDFENAVFDRSRLVLHLDKEVYQGGSLPNLLNGGAAWEVGKFNTKTK